MDNSKKYKNFEEFFKIATDNEPYPYQTKLSKSEIPSILHIPTGAGKTESAILALWLWRRLNDEKIPRRLIYCLPMRVLVEQTEKRVEEWLKKLGLSERVKVVSYMGDYKKAQIDDLEKHPEQEYILIGTQDMLLSGALNRAYGSTVYRWPITFGLLNNDSMWVMDEVQLMENGLPSSIQLDAFRRDMGTHGSCRTVWMSATINEKWMKTVDSENFTTYRLKEEDCSELLKKRNRAVKTLQKADVELEKEYNEADADKLYILHKPNTVTAIMVNTVQRAQNLYNLFRKKGHSCTLVHSRFRAHERKELNDRIGKINESADEIIISTQVLEAGVDMSARTMITELAPWPSMVQRFGRCNRKGEEAQADVYWIDIKDENIHVPYEANDLEDARTKLYELDGKSVSPANLPEINDSKIFDAVLRRIDLINFFDTSSDLSGNHTDASRFVRSMKHSLDVYVFWRDDTDSKSRPEREEMCSVRIGDLKKLLEGKYGHMWDHTEDEWKKIYPRDIFPGQKIMLDCKIGGYSKEYGFDVTSKDRVDAVMTQKNEGDSENRDPESISKKPVTLKDHTSHVLQEMNDIVDNIDFLDKDTKDMLCIAAKYHDTGKAHKVFQDTMKLGIDPTNVEKDQMWAKSTKGHSHSIPGFRHEVASTFAYLQHGDTKDKKTRDLVSYLIMSHHGKVRLQLKSITKKNPPGYLLGYKIDGDTLPGFSRDHFKINETHIDMSIAKVGQESDENESWAGRAVRLRDDYGPFRLAYLEALIRAADGRASMKENNGEYAR